MKPNPTVFFTLCSNNYLAMAKTLSESVKQFHPDSLFVIGLVDTKIPEIDYTVFHDSVLPVEDLNITHFDRMQLNYNIIELNTSVKPYYFQYLFETYRYAETVVYLDPDTVVFHPLDSILPVSENDAIVLTPHTSEPIPLDGMYPDENLVLNHGIYNLGFLALRRSANSEQLLSWWAERMVDRCKIDLVNGMFTDQLYMNLAPLFFQGTRIEKHPGLNIASWNLHYRKLRFQDDKWLVNGSYPLILFHFSGFIMNDETKVGRGVTRFVLNSESDLKKLYDGYRQTLLKNNWEKYKMLTPYFVSNREKFMQEQYWNKLRKHKVLMLVHYGKKLIPVKLLNRISDKLRFSKY